MIQSEAKNSVGGGWNHMSSLFKSSGHMMAHASPLCQPLFWNVLDRLTAYSDICKSQQSEQSD